VIAKRKGVTARKRLKEVWSKRTSRCTRTGSEHTVPGERQMIAKPISIQGTECKFGGCVRKVGELTSGDLPLVRDTGRRIEGSVLTGRQKSAAGVLCAEQRVVQEG
jgi:hypothetical protein